MLRRQPCAGNKSTAGRPSDEAAIAIFVAISTVWRCGIIFPVRPGGPASQGIRAMAKVRKLLAKAPGRIGRRFARFVEIAAAGLHAAGV